MCARRRSNFLLSRQEKVTKEKTTPSLRPPFALSGERGQPAMLGPGVVPQNSLRLAVGQTPFKQLRQARSRSACVLRHTHPPQALRFSAQPAGVGSGYRTAAAFAAAPGVGYALRAADGLGAIALPRPSEAMARMEPAPTPF